MRLSVPRLHRSAKPIGSSIRLTLSCWLGWNENQPGRALARSLPDLLRRPRPARGEVFAVPGLVPLGGWRDDQVSLGYVEVGAGRLWLVESDWQDAETRGAAFEASRVTLRRLVELRR